MRYDLASSFNKPEFQALLTKYEEMKQNQTHVYLESNELTHLAEYYACKGNTRASEEVIDYGLKLHPENLDILIYKCNNLTARGKTDEALCLLESLPDQNDREVRLTYAGLYIEKSDIEEAERIFRQLAEEEEEDIATLLDIADIYMDANLGKHAYCWLKKAYSKAPNDIEVMESMADYHYTFESVEKAVTFYNKLLDENPYHIRYWIELIRCHLQTGDAEQAMEAIDFALTIDDKNLACIEMKGYCHQLLGENSLAFQCYHQVEQAVSDKSRIRQVILSSYFLEKNYKKTLEYCNLLLTHKNLKNFELADIYHKRAVCHLYSEQYRECKEDLQNGLAYDKEYGELYIVEGELFLLDKNRTEAENSFRKAEAFSMEKAEATQQIAMAWLRQEYFDQALELYLQVEKEYPEEAQQCYCYMAFCYHRKKDIKNMLKYIIRSCVYTPEAFSNANITRQNMGADQNFFNVAIQVLEEIRKGRLDPSSHL